MTIQTSEAPSPKPRTNGSTPTDTPSVSITYTETSRRSAPGAEREAAVDFSALPIDLKTLPLAALRALLVAVPLEIERQEQAQIDAAIASMQQQADALGIPLARFMAALDGRKPAARKRAGASESGVKDGRSHVKDVYWNPKDHSQRTHGRGPKKPQWFLDHLAGGGTVEDMRIPPEHQDDEK